VGRKYSMLRAVVLPAAPYSSCGAGWRSRRTRRGSRRGQSPGVPRRQAERDRPGGPPPSTEISYSGSTDCIPDVPPVIEVDTLIGHRMWPDPRRGIAGTLLGQGSLRSRASSSMDLATPSSSLLRARATVPSAAQDRASARSGSGLVAEYPGGSGGGAIHPAHLTPSRGLSEEESLHRLSHLRGRVANM